MSTKVIKYISVCLLVLVFAAFGTGVAKATVTIDATSVISSAALTLTGAATSVWSLSSGALTINSANTSALTLDSGTTGAVNLATGANAKTITIGNAASTLLDLDAISIDIDGAGTGVTIDALDAGSINLGTSAVSTSDTSPINIGTSATARTISLGGGEASTFVINGRVASEAIAGTEIGLGATYAYGEGLEMRYGVDSWTGIGNSFKGYYFRSSANVGSTTGGLRGMEVYGVSNVTTGTTGLSNLQSLYAEMLVKASATSKTITDASSVEANVSIENQTGTLTFTNNVYALKAKVQTGTGLADYTKMGGIAVQGRDDGTSRVFGNAISIENPEATVATWTRGLSISAGTTTAISLTGAATTGISIANTATTGINFAGGAANQAIKVGALSSATPGSGAVISDTNNRAMDINVDDNNVASADTAKLLSVARFRLMRYADSVAEDYAVHGLVKYSELTKSRWGAGVMGAAETTGAVTLSNLTTGVLGRFGTAATLTLTGAGDRIAAVTAFNNNTVALAGSGKSAGLLVMETDVGTPIDLDYGLEIRNSVAITGIKIGTATTDIELQNGETIDNAVDGQFLFSRNTDAAVTLMAADSSGATALTIDTTGAGTITVGSADVTVVTITSAATDAGLVLPNTSVSGAEMVSNTVTATQLSAALTFAALDFVDLALVVQNTTANQGLRLPQAASATPSSPTSGEGYLAWNVAGNQLIAYDGSAWITALGNATAANTWTDNQIYTFEGDEDIAITSTAITTTVVPIVANSLTTGIGESIASTAAAITGAGRLLYVNHGGATSSDGILSEFITAATDETVVLRVSSAAMIDGVNLSVVGTTGMTTGSLIRATTSTAGLVATNGIVSIRGTGAHTSTANAGLLDVQSSGLVGTAANGTLVNFQTTAAAQVNTTVLNVENSGFTAGYTGSMLRIKSTTTDGAARVVDLIADGITSGGTAMKISTAALTTGDGLLITNGTSAITTGSLLNVTASGTGTIADDGVVKFSHAGIYGSTSNAGFVNITANATTAGTVLAVNATGLVDGIGIYSPSAEAGLTTGKYLSLGGVFTVAKFGATVIAGSAAGTAALTLSLGDLVLVDTDTTTITSVNGTTTVVLIDNAGGVQADNTAALLIDAGGNNASGSNMLRLAPTGTPVEASIGIEFVGSAKVMQAMSIDGDSVNNSVVLFNGGGALADNKAVLEVTADGTMVAGSSLVRIASTTAAGGATVYGLEISANAANLEGLWVSAGLSVFAENVTITAGGLTITAGDLLVSDGAMAAAVETVASATNMAVDSNVVSVTGTTTIATITGGVAGQLLTLIFTASLTVTDDDSPTAANAINVVGAATNFAATVTDTLTLVFDGTSWYEVSRSVND